MPRTVKKSHISDARLVDGVNKFLGNFKAESRDDPWRKSSINGGL